MSLHDLIKDLIGPEEVAKAEEQYIKTKVLFQNIPHDRLATLAALMNKALEVNTVTNSEPMARLFNLVVMTEVKNELQKVEKKVPQ